MTVYLITRGNPAEDVFLTVAGDEQEAMYNVVSSDKNLDYPRSDFVLQGTLEELKDKTEDSNEQVYRKEL